MTEIHHAIFSTISDVLEKRPSLAYLFSTVSVSSGWMPWIDGASKVVGLFAACVGLVVALYTLKIQKKNWESINKK